MIKYRGSTETNHDNYTMPRIQLFVEPSLLPFSASHMTWFYVHTLAILSCPNIMGPGLCARGTQPMCNYKYFISPQGMSSHSLPVGKTFFYPALSVAGNFLSLLMPRSLVVCSKHCLHPSSSPLPVLHTFFFFSYRYLYFSYLYSQL